jgi:hypothetical protein
MRVFYWFRIFALREEFLQRAGMGPEGFDGRIRSEPIVFVVVSTELCKLI